VAATIAMLASARETWQKVKLVLQGVETKQGEEALADFSMKPRALVIALMAIVVGILAAFIALFLLRLIGLFTNLFFFQHWSTTLVSPAGNKLGWLEVLVPVIGGFIVGLMARYGSERIRGHGIPEAMEAILIRGSKVEPKVTLLKPLASAISIGTGGPFGAEGPIIVTGGALGSLIAQFFRLSNTERKTLLVAGAAAGMSAIFFSPVSAVLMAVEVLLFEWKPRSVMPVALASGTAALLRYYIIGPGPLFPVPPHAAFIGWTGLLSCVFVGLLAAIVACLLTVAVYASEDTYRKLPIHWMWWPMIGGLIVGIGGLISPESLGVGYDVIEKLLQGNTALDLLLGILIVKSIIWSTSLASGTSGGILAPLLLIGGALGGALGTFLPFEGHGFWVLICMAAMLGGAMRSPLTAIIFTLELTHDINAALPLLIAVMVSYGFTVLVLHRSIITEKVARRGYHVSREYATDALEVLFVREVMRTNIVALPASATLNDLRPMVEGNRVPRVQRLFPVVDADNMMIGVVTRNDLRESLRKAEEAGQLDHSPITSILAKPVVAYPDETLRMAVYRMAETGYTRFPVVEREDPRRLVGMLSLNDVLKAHTRSINDERKRERVLKLRLLFPQHNETMPVQPGEAVKEEEDELEKTKEPFR
jgi:CIC family chloride channel protein